MSDVPWSWFLMRATGVVGLALLTVAVVLGIVGPRLRPTARLASITVHRAASAAGLLVIVVHVVSAVLDPWVELGWAAAIVPGASAWERGGVAAGAVAVDLLVVLALTTATRLAAPRLWRRVHLLGYPVWALAAGHGLLVGSDPAATRATAAIGAAAVLGAVAVRLLIPAVVPRPLGGVPDDALAGGWR
jgi:sulfoxide reductase heme-binding subunit YedZ